MTVTDEQKATAYHCGIDGLLKAAYLNDLSALEMAECKTDFPTFDDWYHTLNTDQKHRVDAYLADQYMWIGYMKLNGEKTIRGNKATI